MLRTFRPARRNSAKSLASAFAMAIALAGGAVVGNAGFATQVQAQEYSDDFVPAYQPVADVVNAEDGDIASVAGQFPSIISLAQTADDKFAAGNLILIAGNKTSNPAWQRQGLELQLESGKVPPESVGQFSWFIGNLAYQMGEYAAARTALQAAADNGWTENDPTGLIAETYFEQDDSAGGVAYIVGMAQQRDAAGGQVPEQWLLRGLQGAYDEEMLSQATDLSVLLVQHHTSQQNWINALQVINAVADFDDQTRLDFLRLMRTTDALTDSNEFIRYIEAADPRIMSNEVADVLAEGLAAGEFAADDIYYVEVKDIVDGRMADDRAEAPSLVAEAESEAGGLGAMTAGDVLYSIDDFAGAEAMYAMAADKGGVDANTVLTRQGIAQARQGKVAEAQATLAQVTGSREPVARMWAAYAATTGS